jgi:(p)ppGpp synthase/HD superfamily hydrolase
MVQERRPGLDPVMLDRPSVDSHAKRTIHLRGFLLGHQYYRAAQAMDYASEFHTGVRKDGTTPEFAHQVYIVSYLSTLIPHLRYPEETLAVGFLHDIVEDYDVGIDRIEAAFGAVIAEGADAMSKQVDGVRRSDDSVAQRQAASPVASIVKCADRINNQQTMAGVFDESKILEYVSETRQHIMPMIKKAQRRFPDQDLAYQNAKTVLYAQIEMLEAALSGLLGRTPNHSSVV